VRGGLGGADAFVGLLAFSGTVGGGLTFSTAFEGLWEVRLQLEGGWSQHLNINSTKHALLRPTVKLAALDVLEVQAMNGECVRDRTHLMTCCAAWQRG
jgi:hypothetical protein